MRFLNRRNMLFAAVAFAISGAVHSHATAAERHIVDFRLMQWRAKHCHDTGEADSHYKALKSLGCQVEKHEHNGHIDLRYRLPFWKSLALKSDQEAHKWQKYLNKMGFETKHEH